MKCDGRDVLPQIRAVIDTNVLYSGLTHRGIPFRIVQAGQAGRFTWIFSNPIIAEYVDLFSRKNLMELIHPSLSWLKRNGVRVDVPDFLPDMFTEITDVDDRPIFAAAYVAGAIFVTGDRHHFPWSSYKSIRIMPPADFYDIL